jgi:hypothetical protein
MKYGSEIKSGYYNQWHRNPDTAAINNDNLNRLSIGLEDFATLKRKEKRNWKIQQELEQNNVNHIKLWTIWGRY